MSCLVGCRVGFFGRTYVPVYISSFDNHNERISPIYKELATVV